MLGNIKSKLHAKLHNILTLCSLETPFQPGYLFQTCFYIFVYSSPLKIVENRVEYPTSQIYQATSLNARLQSNIRVTASYGLCQQNEQNYTN